MPGTCEYHRAPAGVIYRASLYYTQLYITVHVHQYEQTKAVQPAHVVRPPLSVVVDQ